MSRREEAQSMPGMRGPHESNGDQETQDQKEDIMEMAEMFLGVVKILKTELKTIGFEEEDHQVELIQTFFDSWVG